MRRLGLCLFSVALLSAAPAGAQATGDIEVTIHTVRAIDSSIDLNVFFNNQAEFYAEVSIAGGSVQQSPWIPGKDYAPLNFVASQTVPRDVRFQPVQIDIWDHDELGDFSDDSPDHCDVNPAAGTKKLDLVFDTCTFKWTGSSSGGPEIDLAAGAGDSDRAELNFQIGTADDRPFSPDDVAIRRAVPAQVVYDPEFIVSGKATVLRVDFTSSYAGPRTGSVTATVRDGIGNMLEETREVTVPPEGATVFFFDGSEGIGPFVPFGNPNSDSFCWDVIADFGIEGPPTPPPALINCYGDNNQVVNHCKRMVNIDNPTTVYVSWDWDTSASFATVTELVDTFNSSEDFREATSPISARESFLAPFHWTTPGPGAPVVEPLLTMARAAPAAMLAGIDRMILTPRPGWFADNDANSDHFGPGNIGISLGEFLPSVVISEAGFSQTAMHEFGHTYRLSRRNCDNGGIWEYLFDLGCRDEYNHFPGTAAPYPATGFDVLGNVFPGGAGPVVPGTRDVNSLNIMGSTGASVFTYDRWIDNLNYNWLVRELATAPPTPLPEAQGGSVEVFNLTGLVQAANGIGGSPPQFVGQLFPLFTVDAAVAAPDVEEAMPGEPSGSGAFAARLVTAQGIREYRFMPALLAPEGEGPVDATTFSIVIPWDDTTSRLELHGPTDLYTPDQNQDTLLFAMDRSAIAPSVQNIRAGLDTPPTQAGPQPEPPTLPPGRDLGISWTTIDPDSVSLSSNVILISPAPLWGTIPLAIDEKDDEFVLPAAQVANLPPGDYGLRVHTSDGMNDSSFEVAHSFTVCHFSNGGNEICDGLDNDCNGLVDDTAQPVAASGVLVDGLQVLWDTTATASGYDVVLGDLATLAQSQGNLGSTVLDCLAEDLPATSILHSAAPPLGGGFWYLVRPSVCGGNGPWDSGGPGQVISRESGLANACPDCVHARCDVGPGGTPFSASCDSCVASICAADSYCCDTDWDSLCVAAVRTVCGSLWCDEAAGSCSHSVCLEGVSLAAGCDDPPVSPSCVTTICAADPYCCGTAWDSLCVDEVISICGANCN